MRRALLDANVFISAMIRQSGTPGRIVTAFLEKEAFTLLMSPAIISEVEVAFAFPKIRKYLRGPATAIAWLADIVALADLVKDSRVAKGVCRDPYDDAVLGAAFEGRADVIVTGDRDLLVIEEYENIRILTPREFLKLI